MFSAITLEYLNRFWIFKRQFHLIFNRQSVGLRIFLFTCKTKKVAKCKQIIVMAIIWHDVTSAATWPNSSNSGNSISNDNIQCYTDIVLSHRSQASADIFDQNWNQNGIIGRN